MKEDMPAIDLSAIDSLKALHDEQQLIKGRIEKMEEMRDRVSQAVFDKVNGEHQAKLNELESQAAPLRDQVRAEYAKLKTVMDQLEKEIDAKNLEKEEIDLRHAIGEFDEAVFRDKIKQWEVGHVEKQAELESLQDMKRMFVNVFDSEDALEEGLDAVAAETPAADLGVEEAPAVATASSTATAMPEPSFGEVDDAAQPSNEPLAYENSDHITAESTAAESTADDSTADDSTAAASTAAASTADDSTADDSTADDSTAAASTVADSTAAASTVADSTAAASTAAASQPDGETSGDDPDRITTEDLEDTPDADAFVNPEDDLDDADDMLTSDDLEEEPEELSTDAMLDDDAAETVIDDQPMAIDDDAESMISDDNLEEPDAWAAVEVDEDDRDDGANWTVDTQGEELEEDPDATLLHQPNPFLAEDVDESSARPDASDEPPGTMAMPMPAMDDDADDGATVMMNPEDLPLVKEQTSADDEHEDIDDHITDLDNQLNDDTDDLGAGISPPPIPQDPATDNAGDATEIMQTPNFDDPRAMHDVEMTTPIPPPRPEDLQTAELDDPETEAASEYDAKDSGPEAATMLMNQDEMMGDGKDDTDGTMIISNPKIVALNSAIEGQVIVLGMGTTSIGRSPDNDLHLTEDRISRKHSQITFGPGGYAIYDLNSENGTYINGNRIREHFLADGDIIMIGTYKFLYRDH